MSKEKSCLLKIVKKTLVNTYTSINRKLVKNKNRTVVHPHKVLLYSIKHSILSENWIYFFNVKRKKIRMFAELIPFIWNYGKSEAIVTGIRPVVAGYWRKWSRGWLHSAATRKLLGWWKWSPPRLQQWLLDKVYLSKLTQLYTLHSEFYGM